MNLKDNRITIPYAFASSDKIDVGAKGIIDAQHREGVVYARYKKLKGLMKIENGKRNFDIFGAKKSFDAYMQGQ